MKSPLVGYFPCALAAIGFVAFGFVLKLEMDTSRRLAEAWAERDLSARTELAAASIGDALATGDFNRLREFADMRRSNDLRLTVLSAPGGMVYDSEPTASGNHAGCPEVRAALETGTGCAIRVSHITGQKMLYCARKAGDDFIVRLSLPYEVVIDPLRRNRLAMVLSALVGASGLLLVLLFSIRLVARNRALARERDAKAQLLAELQRVADFRRDFIANVSHEIKTPLTGILGAADLMDAHDPLAAMIKKEARRLQSLVQEILDLARLERDGETVRLEEADLADLVRETVERLQPKARTAGVDLAVDGTSAASLRWACDPQLLEQALTNLVENALRHSGSPTVRVSCARMGSEARLVVADAGRGVPPDEAERIFERFHRVDSARAAETGGAGLGLAIVRRIARLHGGDVVCEPVVPHGARFVLRIK